MELDISKIVAIPSEEEVTKGFAPTKRALCAKVPENAAILADTESIIKIISDINADVKQPSCPSTLQTHLDELLGVYTQLNPADCNLDIFSDSKYQLIDNLEDLKKYLSELLIKFDTVPQNYTKADYSYLIGVLYKSLIFIYANHPLAVITPEWLDPHSDSKVPSEKLVKETIDSIEDSLHSEITLISEDLREETETRRSEILRVAELISNEETARIEADNYLDGLISAETSARELADLNLQNTKQDNLTAGDNISIINNIISAVDTTYQASDFDIKDLSDSTNLRNTWDGKLDELTAGDNIQINGTTISATDTIYDDTEVRGLIDVVDLKVDNLDEFTCGTITPTTTNFVEGTDYTVHEALQRTANLFEGYQGEIDDINALIPNQTTPSNPLADKAFVNSTVATNAANFRGNWANYTAIPTNASDYPADYSGSKTPTNNDYLVVQDGTDYGSSYTGMWRFIYTGDWSLVGKSGWAPLYRVGSAFTAELQAAIDSGITSAKVTKYEGYNTSIGALLTDKLDKVYTANKVYGTNNLGVLTAYIAGTGISFENGQINSTIQEDLLPLIYAGL